MPRCIAFLRAVNVGGRVVRMDALRTAFEALGLARVQTFIASGNVIFDTRARSLGALERRIEAHLLAACGFEIDTFIRTAEELAVIAAHPRLDAADEASALGTRVVCFLAAAPDAAARQRVERLGSDVDRFAFDGRELYWLSRLKQSEATFSNAALERLIGMRSTLRNVSTLRKLVEQLANGG